MGLFGPSESEKLLEEIYPLLYQALDRCKAARLLKENLDAVSQRASWLNKDELQSISDALESYSFAMLAVALAKVNSSPVFKNRPFLNVAVQPKIERAVLDTVFGSEEGFKIKLKVSDFDGDDLPSIQEILVSTLAK